MCAVARLSSDYKREFVADIDFPVTLVWTRPITRLEDRQNRSFVEDLASAKEVARLESELRAKGFEGELRAKDLEGELRAKGFESELRAMELRFESELRVNEMQLAGLGAELKATHAAAAAHARQIVNASAFAVAATTALAVLAVWRR
jgi:hypothetical protein